MKKNSINAILFLVLIFFSESSFSAVKFSTLSEEDHLKFEKGLAKFVNPDKKWTVINFWASWCGPCQIEMKSLSSFAKKYKNNAQVISISIDQQKDKHNAMKLLKQSGLEREAKIEFDSQKKLFKNLNMRLIPSTFFFKNKKLARATFVDINFLDRDLLKEIEQ